MLTFLLIVLYTALFLYLLYRLTKRDRPYLPVGQLSMSFIVKIGFGLLYGFLFMRFYHGDDTWQAHTNSLIEYNKLLYHPFHFILDTFSASSGSISLEAASSTTNSYWNDFDEVLFIRMLAVFDVFTFGNYYVNVVFFCFIAYIGNLLFFRLMVSYYPRSSFLLLLVIFYYPVVLFWLSGIRKEGLLFLGMAMTLYYFNKLLEQKLFLWKNLLLFIAGMATLWFIRNMVVLCIAPALAAWYLQKRFRLPGLATFAGVYFISVVLFFSSSAISGLPHLAQKITERQYSFMALKGNTRLELDSLHGTFSSFVHVFPQALNHSFLQPYIMQSRSVLQLISALDIFLFFGCMAMAFLYRRINWTEVFSNPFILTCLFTAFSGYLIIGYIVPFPGAFVRYKSIFELLFIPCFAVCAETDRINKIKKTNISAKPT